MLRNSKTTVTLLVLLLVLVIGYYLMSRPADPLMMEPNLENGNLVLQSEKILADINKLNRISISGSLFADEAFRSLVDRRVPLPETPTGRPNPFAPVQ